MSHSHIAHVEAKPPCQPTRRLYKLQLKLAHTLFDKPGSGRYPILNIWDQYQVLLVL